MYQTWENGKKKPSFEPDFSLFGPNLGHQSFFFSTKIWLRQSLDIMVSYHMYKSHKKQFLNGRTMVFRTMVVCVFIFNFLFRTNGKKENLDENNFRNFFESAALKVTWSQLCSKFFRNNYNVYWQRYLRDSLLLKILRKWVNISANFLG